MNEIIEKLFENINPSLIRETGYTKYEILLLILMGTTVPMVDKLNVEAGTPLMSNSDIFKIKLKIFPDKAKLIRKLFSSGTKTVTLTPDITELARNLIELFPSGKKPNTQLYWKGGIKEISERLVRFFNEYGQIAHTDILESAKIYVSSFDFNDRRYMQVLKYFIIKKKDVGFESTLYNMITNNNEGYTTSEDIYSDRFGIMMYVGR